MTTHAQLPLARMVPRSHVGRRRSRNEDAVVIEAEQGLAILADGMGGLAAGDVASSTAVRCLRSVLLRRSARHADVLARAIHQANRKVEAIARGEGGPGSMGTTVVVWQLRDANCALIAHVGDSRCYREHRGVLTQLTRDHSVVQMQMDAGLLNAESAWQAPNRHLITQALGLGDPVTVDVIESPVAPGDRFLLCSDGLSDMVSPVELAALFAGQDDDDRLADTLLLAALDAGGRDNISLVVIRI